jgi:type IV secretory pathway VirB2 component (pilin)
MHALFAQSLGEYGALGSVASGIQQLAYSITTSLESVNATTWAIVAIAVLGFVFWRRR